MFNSPKVRVLEMEGVISSKPSHINMEKYSSLIDRAFSGLKPERDHVVLDINSPGGSPVQSKLIADKIRRKAEAGGIQVHACISDMGASGGYWLACAADSIVASPMSLVGSIGVVSSRFGFPVLLEKHGVERRVHTAGASKAILDPFRPEREEDVRLLGVLLGNLHAEFKNWVGARRGGALTPNGVDLFSGMVWDGREAVGLGLVDELGDVDRLCCSLLGGKGKPSRIKPKAKFLQKLPIPGMDAMAEALVEAVAARMGPSLPGMMWP